MNGTTATVEAMMQKGWPLEKIERVMRRRVRREVVYRALVIEHGHCQRAAARIGVHRNTLSRLLSGSTPRRPGPKSQQPAEPAA